MNIRIARPSDAHEMLEIYRPFVEETAVSFESAPPSVEGFTRKLEQGLLSYPWFVATVNMEDSKAEKEESGKRVIGYAYASEHRSRCAYQWSAECSVYVDKSFTRRGIARSLYQRVFASLRAQGFIQVFAGISLPNEASVAFHESMGFRKIGVYKNIGFKLGRWRDVGWWQLQLPKSLQNVEPKKPRPFIEIGSNGLNARAPGSGIWGFQQPVK